MIPTWHFFPLGVYLCFFLSVGRCNTPVIIHGAEASPKNFLLHLTGVMIWCCVSWLIAVSLKCEHGFFQHRASGSCAASRPFPSYLYWGGRAETKVRSYTSKIRSADFLRHRQRLAVHPPMLIFFVCKLMRVHYFLPVSPFYNICTTTLHKEQPSAQSL